jgi:O-glycosyl hydrolase
MGGQEGCAFSQQNQQLLIKEVYKSLEKNKMLGYCSISAMDANGIDQCLKGIQGYEKAGDIIPLIKQVNAHSYADTNRVELGRLARKLGLRLWQSESGPLDVNISGFDNYLFMAQRIVTDIRELQPEVWCDWQLASQGLGDGRWGLLSYDPVKKIYQREKSYYIRKQFSKFIQPGFNLINGCDHNSLSAISADNKQLVIVIVNEETSAKDVSIDLSKFLKTGKSARLYRTSVSEDCKQLAEELPVVNKKSIYIAPAQSVTTIQLDVSVK